MAAEYSMARDPASMSYKLIWLAHTAMQVERALRQHVTWHM